MEKSKYPIELYVNDTNEDTSGHMFRAKMHYLSNGLIGKARLIVWENRRLTVLYYAIKQGKLVINKIEKNTENGEKVIIFKI